MSLHEILLILCMVESSMNPLAVGDNGKAVGILQIQPIFVKDVNRILKAEIYTKKDRLEVQSSFDMAQVYIRHYLGDKPTYNPKYVAMLFNGGPNIRKSNKRKQSNLNNYWEKVQCRL